MVTCIYSVRKDARPACSHECFPPRLSAGGTQGSQSYDCSLALPVLVIRCSTLLDELVLILIFRDTEELTSPACEFRPEGLLHLGADARLGWDLAAEDVVHAEHKKEPADGVLARLALSRTCRGL